MPARAARLNMFYQPEACLASQFLYYVAMKTSHLSPAAGPATSAGPAGSARCLGDLISGIRGVIAGGTTWSDTADLVADQLRLHLPSPAILTAEQRYGDPLHYRCHLLHAEPDGSFSVVALVWRPGQATTIHDHVTWCVYGVIQGAETEQRYTLHDDGWLEEAGRSVNAVGDVDGLAPPGDIHLVRNEGTETAISLHVYGTDISRLGSSVRRNYDLPVFAR
jgi:3-mercaptopropionate dioxygenase